MNELGNGYEKAEGTMDFYGFYDPAHGPTHYSTFSVAVFRWVLRADGKGTKRGPVIVRISGQTDNPEPVYEKALARC